MTRPDTQRPPVAFAFARSQLPPVARSSSLTAASLGGRPVRP